MTNGMKVLFVILIIALKVRADCQAGEDCNKNCSTNCRLLPNGNPHCNHITGECSEGCVPGFFTKTCNVTCSDHCPKNLCDVTQGTCLLSSENPRRGSYCEGQCNDTTTTLNSEGNTCTVPWTLSLILAGIIGVIVSILFLFLLSMQTSRHWEDGDHRRWTIVRDIVFILIYLTVLVADNSCPNCRQNKCDDNNECLHGCKRGFAGSKCIHKCSSNCVHSKCYLNVNTGAYPCLIGCTPGYHGYQCNAPCTSTDKEGKCDRFTGTSPDCDGISYGTNCEASCSSMCDGFMCDNTGRCLDEVCIPGLHGPLCDKACESSCMLCQKDTGECLRFKSKELLYNRKCSCDIADSSHDYRVYLGFIIAILLANLISTLFKPAIRDDVEMGEPMK